MSRQDDVSLEERLARLRADVSNAKATNTQAKDELAAAKAAKASKATSSSSTSSPKLASSSSMPGVRTKADDAVPLHWYDANPRYIMVW
jgi:phage shock protein A